MVRVYLKIDEECHLYRGAGAWGNGKTVEAARKIARKHLRESFGSSIRKVKETVEDLEEEEV